MKRSRSHTPVQSSDPVDSCRNTKHFCSPLAWFLANTFPKRELPVPAESGMTHPFRPRSWEVLIPGSRQLRSRPRERGPHSEPDDVDTCCLLAHPWLLEAPGCSQPLGTRSRHIQPGALRKPRVCPERALSWLGPLSSSSQRSLQPTTGSHNSPNQGKRSQARENGLCFQHCPVGERFLSRASTPLSFSSNGYSQLGDVPFPSLEDVPQSKGGGAAHRGLWNSMIRADHVLSMNSGTQTTQTNLKAALLPY